MPDYIIKTTMDPESLTLALSEVSARMFHVDVATGQFDHLPEQIRESVEFESGYHLGVTAAIMAMVRGDLEVGCIVRASP